MHFASHVTLLVVIYECELTTNIYKLIKVQLLSKVNKTPKVGLKSCWMRSFQ